MALGEGLRVDLGRAPLLKPGGLDLNAMKQTPWGPTLLAGVKSAIDSWNNSINNSQKWSDLINGVNPAVSEAAKTAAEGQTAAQPSDTAARIAINTANANNAGPLSDAAIAEAKARSQIAPTSVQPAISGNLAADQANNNALLKSQAESENIVPISSREQALKLKGLNLQSGWLDKLAPDYEQDQSTSNPNPQSSSNLLHGLTPPSLFDEDAGNLLLSAPLKNPNIPPLPQTQNGSFPTMGMNKNAIGAAIAFGGIPAAAHVMEGSAMQQQKMAGEIQQRNIEQRNAQNIELRNQQIKNGNVPDDASPQEIKTAQANMVGGLPVNVQSILLPIGKSYIDSSEYKNFNIATSAKDSFDQVYPNSQKYPSIPNDMALFTAFAKMDNPGAIVRGSTIELENASKGWPMSIQKLWQRLNGNNTLLPEQREQLLSTAKDFYTGQANTFEKARKDYIKQGSTATNAENNKLEGFFPSDALDKFKSGNNEMGSDGIMVVKDPTKAPSNQQFIRAGFGPNAGKIFPNPNYKP